MSTKFFNNAPGNTLFDKLKGIASDMTTFDRFLAVVGFFRSSGYFKLRKELGDISEIKILVGINIDDIFRKHNKALLMLADAEKAKEVYQEGFKEDEEKKEERNRFDATLEQIKEALTLLQKLVEAIKEAKECGVTTQKGLDAATKSADNAITGICSAIVKAENTPIKAKLDDESLKQLHGNHVQWLGQEKKTLDLDDHHRQQEESWQKHSQRLTDIVKNNEGVWISTKLFYVVGSLSLLSIITIVMEIAFYVYFHWIQ